MIPVPSLVGGISSGLSVTGESEASCGVPGFVAYYATRAGDTLTSVTVCETQAGTQESTRRASDWVKQNLTGASIAAPQITELETFVQF